MLMIEFEYLESLRFTNLAHIKENVLRITLDTMNAQTVFCCKKTYCLSPHWFNLSVCIINVIFSSMIFIHALFCYRHFSKQTISYLFLFIRWELLSMKAILVIEQLYTCESNLEWKGGRAQKGENIKHICVEQRTIN